MLPWRPRPCLPVPSDLNRGQWSGPNKQHRVRPRKNHNSSSMCSSFITGDTSVCPITANWKGGSTTPLLGRSRSLVNDQWRTGTEDNMPYLKKSVLGNSRHSNGLYGGKLNQLCSVNRCFFKSGLSWSPESCYLVSQLTLSIWYSTIQY